MVEGQKKEDGFEFKTLKAALLSQAHLHAPYGGVYPNLAKREHQKNLPLLFKEFEKEEVDAIAVTQGPGLEPALWQGITFAQNLAQKRGLPLIPVNHMEAHLISSLAQRQHSNILQNVGMSEWELKGVQLPVLALLVSGGHTEFVLMKEWFRYEVIGETLDDAVGECFDKVARMLGLPYPGGPAISKIADAARSKSQISNIKLPRPMLHTNNCDVSFSGLKTAALYALRGTSTSLSTRKNLSEEEKAAFAAEFEDAVTEVFVLKTRRALQETDAKTFVIGGGVAANRHLREQLQALVLEDFPDVEFRLPELSITGDNAVMIAMTALVHLLTSHLPLATGEIEIRAIGNLSIAR